MSTPHDAIGSVRLERSLFLELRVDSKSIISRKFYDRGKKREKNVQGKRVYELTKIQKILEKIESFATVIFISLHPKFDIGEAIQ